MAPTLYFFVFWFKNSDSRYHYFNCSELLLMAQKASFTADYIYCSGERNNENSSARDLNSVICNIGIGIFIKGSKNVLLFAKELNYVN